MRKSLTIEARSRADYVSLLEESLGRLVETLSTLDGAERVSLFGSCARRREDLFTHLDVLVVMRGEEPFVERVKGSQGMEKNITSGPSSKPVW